MALHVLEATGGSFVNTTLAFLYKDVRAARTAWEKLLLKSIEARHLRFVARVGTNLGILKPANVFQSTDSLREARRGIFIGTGLGLLAGLMALAFPPWYADSHWAVILAITSGIGALTGMLGMALLGVNLQHSGLANYHEAITRGGVLMLVTVDEARVNEITRILRRSNRTGTADPLAKE